MDFVNVRGLMMLPIVALYWGVPLAAAIWAITTLNQVRTAQQAIQVKLDAIERLLQRS